MKTVSAAAAWLPVLCIGAALLSANALAGVAAKHANFVGTWALNAAKSQPAEARDVTLTIDMSGDVLKLALASKKGDTSAVSQFSCDTASGTECVFDEPGHKSKASVYFNGDVLNIWKSDGPAGDVAAQWKLEISADGKTLTGTISHLEPAGKEEVLVFAKKGE